jgi:hypothetical protein
MSNYRKLINEIIELGIGKYIFACFDTARESGFEHSLVILPDSEYNEFDIYFTGFVKGSFGEYASWTEVEFLDDPELVSLVTSAVKNIYSQIEPEEKKIQLEGVYGFYFNSYS